MLEILCKVEETSEIDGECEPGLRVGIAFRGILKLGETGLMLAMDAETGRSRIPSSIPQNYLVPADEVTLV